MSRKMPTNGPKLDKDQLAAQRKEQFGFANMVKEQEFRNMAQGEIKSLNDRVRELTDMLEDRKSANRMLTTENARLKKLVADLQFQLLSKPSARGESTALKSMRELARQFQSQEAMTAAKAEKLVSELLAQNQAAVEEIQQLEEERQAAEAELASTRESLDASSAQVAALLAAQAELSDEKEELIRRGEQQEMEAAQALARLAAEVESLQGQLAQAAEDAEAARVAAEATLRSQKAALLAEAHLQRQAAVAEVQAQVAAVQVQLDAARATLRSLDQARDPQQGWTMREHGLPQTTPLPMPAAQTAAAAPLTAPLAQAATQAAASEPRPAAGPAAQAPAGSSLSGAVADGGGAGGSEAPGSARSRSRRSSRAGSIAESIADASPESVRASREASVAGSAAARSARLGGSGELGSMGASGDQGQELGHARDPSPAVTEAAAAAAIAARLSRPGSAASRSRAASVASGREPGDGGNAEAAPGGGGSAAPSVAGGSAEGTPGAFAAVRPSLDGAQAGTAGISRGRGFSGVAVAPVNTAAAHAAAAAATIGEAPADVPAVAPAPAEALGTRGNVLELLLHDSQLYPGVLGIPAQDFWPHLRLTCPGFYPGGLQHVALVAAASPGPSHQQPLQLRTAHRLHFPDDRRLLAEVARGSAVLRLQDLRPAVVGAFGCPRLVAPAGRSGGGMAEGVEGGGGRGEGGGGAGMVPDGTVERVMVVACRDEHDCASLELFCIDTDGRPTRPFQALSAPWRLQLPETIPPPGPHEFCLDTHTLHRLQADAARASGLFDTAARVFIGRSDGHTYQVWRLADVDARRKATFKALDKVLVHPAEDPWAASAPLATASLPLTAALAAPTVAQLELRNMRRVLAGEPALHLYEPCDEIGTHTLSCRTVVGEKLVCSVRVTARLVREPEVSEQLLGALQPALQSGLSAPSLPPLHWLSLLGAEELLLDRLVGQLRACVAEAAGRLMATPAHDLASERQLAEAARQAADAVLVKERQLEEGLAHCRAVVATVCTFTPEEGPLATARFEGIRERVARSLAALIAFFRQRLELYRLGAAAWHFITAAAGPDDPVARLPATTTPPQAQALAAALQSLAAALRALAPPGSTAGALLAAAAGKPPLALLLPPPAPPGPTSTPAPASAGAVTHSLAGKAAPPPAAPAAPVLADAAGALEAVLRAAVEAAVAGAGDMAEALRRQVAAPGTDDVAAAEGAAVRLATLAAPVTAALVAGLAGLCQAAVAASLAEADTVAALWEQMLATAAAAAAQGAAVAVATAANPTAPLVAELARQLHWQQAAAAAVAAAAATPGNSSGGGGLVSSSSPVPARRSTAAAQLTATLHSLQWLLGGLVRGAAPAAVAASPQSAAAWLRCGAKLRLHAAALGTSWAAAAVAAAGHSLLLTGQRQAAVALALEVMGREVDRVLDATKAALDAIRVNRSYDDAVLSSCMPSIATALTSHAAAAVTACFWLACQLLLTPLLVAWQPPEPPPSASCSTSSPGRPLPAAALHATAHNALQSADHSSSPTATNGKHVSGAAASGGGGGGGGGSGSCYSASLHVASQVSFTLLTLGAMGAGGAAPPPQLPAAADAGRPSEPSLAPMGHPMLTTWQPRGSVLYLDLPRLNAAAAAAAAGLPPDAAPPVDTPALPQLPAAAELLGWTVRHVEEYYYEYNVAAATAADPPPPKSPAAEAAAAADVPSSARSRGGGGSAGGRGGSQLLGGGGSVAASMKSCNGVLNADDAASVVSGRSGDAGGVAAVKSAGGSARDVASIRSSAGVAGGAASAKSARSAGFSGAGDDARSVKGSIAGGGGVDAVSAAWGPGGAEAGSGLSAAPSASHPMATSEKNHGAASVRSASRGGAGGGIAASVLSRGGCGDNGDPGGDVSAFAAAALAMDPAAALSEAKLAARMAAEADVVVVAGARLAEAGSMVKWLTQHGVLVLAAADLQPGGGGGGGGSGGRVSDGDGGTRSLARALVGLLAAHHLTAAAARVLAPMAASAGAATSAGSAAPSGSATSSRRPTSSRAATPRASLSGDAPAPASPATGPAPPTAAAAIAAAGRPTSPAQPALAAAAAPPPPPLQPLAVLTYLPDVALAKPLLAAAGELTHRVGLALGSLQAAFAAAPPLAPHTDMLARHVGRQLGQQALLLEGLLLAPELLRDRHPGAPRPTGAAAAAASQAQAGTAAAGSAAGSLAGGPGLSRQSSLGRLRAVLPSMTPRGTPPRGPSLSGAPVAAPAARGEGAAVPSRAPSVGAAAQPPLAPTAPAAAAAPAAPAAAGAGAGAGAAAGVPPLSAPDAGVAYSTESEDEEVGVSRAIAATPSGTPVAAPGPAHGRDPTGSLAGAGGIAGKPLAALPDDPDPDSDAASVVSASTLGSTLRGGRAQGPGRSR